jgi:hypothetical protein
MRSWSAWGGLRMLQSLPLQGLVLLAPFPPARQSASISTLSPSLEAWGFTALHQQGVRHH